MIIAVVSLHILAALKHHFIDKDNILRRMLPAILFLLFAQNANAEEPLKNWYIIGDQSSLEFIAQQNDAPVKGKFNFFLAAIRFSPDQLEKSLIMAKIELNMLHMDYPDAEKTIKSLDWMDTKKFPTAMFQSTKITHLAKNNYVAEGNLNLHGVNVPVILNFTLEEYSATRAHIKGETTLSRNAFSIGKGEWKATDVIKDEVAVQFDITAQDSPWSAPAQH